MLGLNIGVNLVNLKLGHDSGHDEAPFAFSARAESNLSMQQEYAKQHTHEHVAQKYQIDVVMPDVQIDLVNILVLLDHQAVINKAELAGHEEQD